MAIETRLARRRWLQALAVAGAMPGWAAAQAERGPGPVRLALAWSELPALPRDERLHCIGVWSIAGGRVEIASRQLVPTRAHGIAQLASGDLLAVARRPGLWLRRWGGDGRLSHEAWAEPGRQFNGHVLPSADGRVVYSTEQSNEDGAGCIALRDPQSLKLLDEWPTGGTDPHQLLLAGSTLYAANGGVPTRPETGRAKQALATMDSSLAAFDTRSGRRVGAWRLPDARLSLRHLAWHAASGTLGIALQAEHDDPAERAIAPLLAVLDARGLRSIAPPPGLPMGSAGHAGYAGDIAATAEGFVLSAPRAGAVLGWSSREGWAGPLQLAEACALAAGPCALGAAHLWLDETSASWALPPGCKPDNHALRLQA